MKTTDINLIVGDCINELKKFKDNSINCIITSPPYNKSFFSKQKKTNQIWENFKIVYPSYSDDMPIEDYEKWMINFINLSMEKIKPDGSLFLNHKPIRHNNKVYHPLKFILESNANIYQEIIWDRHNSPNIRKDILVPSTERIYWLVKNKPKVYRHNIDKKYISEVWNISAKPSKNHTAPFPELLVENCVNLTTEEHDLVVDPFMGSGTVGVVCKRLNRNFVGVDIDEGYVETSKQRLEIT